MKKKGDGPSFVKEETKREKAGENKKKVVKKQENPEDLIPKVDRPDHKSYSEEKERLDARLRQLKERRDAVRGNVQEQNKGGEEFKQDMHEIRELLDECNKECNDLYKKKNDLWTLLKSKNEEGQKMKNDADSMKKKFAMYGSEEEIKKAIQKVEFEMQTSTMSLKQEKAKLEEIKKLKACIPKVSVVKEMTDKANNFSTTATSNIKEQLEVVNNDIRKAKANKDEAREKYNKLKLEKDGATSGLSQLREERNELDEKILELVGEKQKLTQKFAEDMKGFNAYKDEVQKIRYERIEKEKEEHANVERKKEASKKIQKLSVNPFLAEIQLLNQTLGFCRGLQKENKEEDVEEKKEIEVKNCDASHMVLKSKKDRDDEMFLEPTKKKNLRKKGAKNSGGQSQAIKHDPHTFTLFKNLGVEPPVNQSDVPTTIKELEDLLETYNKKTDDWEQDLKDKKAKLEKGEWAFPEDEEEKKESAEETKEEASSSSSSSSSASKEDEKAE